MKEIEFYLVDCDTQGTDESIEYEDLSIIAYIEIRSEFIDYDNHYQTLAVL